MINTFDRNIKVKEKDLCFLQKKYSVETLRKLSESVEIFVYKDEFCSRNSIGTRVSDS